MNALKEGKRDSYSRKIYLKVYWEQYSFFSEKIKTKVKEILLGKKALILVKGKFVITRLPEE